MTSKLVNIIDYVPFTKNREIYAELGTSAIIQAMRDYKHADTKEEREEVVNWFKSDKKKEGSFVMFIKLVGADIERIREGIFRDLDIK